MREPIPALAPPAERGYQLDSRALNSSQTTSAASHILAMDTENLPWPRAIAPSAFEGELRLLGLTLAESGASVPDPYCGVRGFEDVLDMCERTSDGLIAYLKEIGEL